MGVREIACWQEKHAPDQHNPNSAHRCHCKQSRAPLHNLLPSSESLWIMHTAGTACEQFEKRWLHVEFPIPNYFETLILTYRFGSRVVFKWMHAVKRHILHSAPAVFTFPLQKQIQRKTRTLIHCYQNSSLALLPSPEGGIQQRRKKIRNYKGSTSPGAETTQQVSPLSTLTALPQRGIAALGNESEQLSSDLGHGVSRKPSTPLGTQKDKPLSQAPGPAPWEACTHTGESHSAIHHGCATSGDLGSSHLKSHHQ